MAVVGEGTCMIRPNMLICWWYLVDGPSASCTMKDRQRSCSFANHESPSFSYMTPVTRFPSHRRPIDAVIHPFSAQTPPLHIETRGKDSPRSWPNPASGLINVLTSAEQSHDLGGQGNPKPEARNKKTQQLEKRRRVSVSRMRPDLAEPKR